MYYYQISRTVLSKMRTKNELWATWRFLGPLDYCRDGGADTDARESAAVSRSHWLYYAEKSVSLLTELW